VAFVSHIPETFRPTTFYKRSALSGIRDAFAFFTLYILHANHVTTKLGSRANSIVEGLGTIKVPQQLKQNTIVSIICSYIAEL